MAATRIVYDNTTDLGKLTSHVAALALEFKAKATQLKAIVDSITDGVNSKSNVEYGNADFGNLIAVKAGFGSAFYDAIYNMATAADAIAESTIAEIDFGAEVNVTS